MRIQDQASRLVNSLARELTNLQDINLPVLVAAFHLAVKRNDFAAAGKIQRALWNHPQGHRPKRPRDIPIMAWGKSRMSEFHPTYLFVSGVPRSGTTALGTLLGASADVAMYVELYSAEYGYCPQMFAPSSIRNLIAENLLVLPDKGSDILEKSATAKFVGDKRPNFMSSFELTCSNFESDTFRVIHIRRNIRELVHSYQRRLDNGSWRKDFRVCVQEANSNNKKVLDALKGPHRDRLLLVDYDVLWRSADDIYALFERTGINPNSVNRRAIDGRIAVAQRVKEKERHFTREENEFIAEYYVLSNEEELRQLAHAQSIR